MTILTEKDEISIDSIRADICSIFHDSSDSIQREEKLFAYFSALFSLLVSVILEEMDRVLYEERYKKEGYTVSRIDERTICCLWGTLTYRRRLLKKEGKKSFYPLDRKMGFEPRKRFSLAMIMRIATAMAVTPSRSASKIIKALTTIDISHQTVVAMKEFAGKKIMEYQEAKAQEIPDKKEVPPSGILVIEGDGIILKSKDGGKKEELHRLQIYTGVRKNGNRTELVGLQCFSGLDRVDLVKQVKMFVQNRFDLSNITVLSNGDGGAGYQYSDFENIVEGCKAHYHFRDRFHVNEKIRTRLSFCKKNLVEAIIHEMSTAPDIKPYIPAWMDTAAAQAETEKDNEEVERLRGYLERNADFIPSLKQRGIITDIHLGTAETNHRSYSYRLKRQGRVWSPHGLEHMAAVLTALKNGYLSEALLHRAAGKNYKKNDRLFKKVTKQVSREERRRLAKQREAQRRKQRSYRPGCTVGRIANYGPSSAPLARLAASIQF